MVIVLLWELSPTVQLHPAPVHNTTICFCHPSSKVFQVFIPFSPWAPFLSPQSAVECAIYLTNLTKYQAHNRPLGGCYAAFALCKSLRASWWSTKTIYFELVFDRKPMVVDELSHFLENEPFQHYHGTHRHHHNQDHVQIKQSIATVTQDCNTNKGIVYVP